MKKLKRWMITLILLILLALSAQMLTSCTKERTDPPVTKKTYTTYQFMIEEVDIDGTTMYSEIRSVRK